VLRLPPPCARTAAAAAAAAAAAGRTRMIRRHWHDSDSEPESESELEFRCCIGVPACCCDLVVGRAATTFRLQRLKFGQSRSDSDSRPEPGSASVAPGRDRTPSRIRLEDQTPSRMCQRAIMMARGFLEPVTRSPWHAGSFASGFLTP
jgi:hypothetical protein